MKTLSQPAWVSCLAALLAAASAGASETRAPMTPRDLWSMARVSDPQLSPDGSMVAFVATTFDIEANKGNSDIWVVPSAGGEPRRLTRSPGPDTKPRWMPDSGALLFLSSRAEDDHAQVYRMPLGGGDPERVVDFPSGVSFFAISPDGRTLAAAGDVFADCTDLECTRRRLEEREKSGVRAVLTDRLFFRAWNAYRHGLVSHLFVAPLDGSAPPRDLTPGPHDTPPLSLGASEDIVFSADGSRLAYVLNADPQPALTTNNDVWEVPLGAGGRVRQVTTGRGNDAGPAYSPDGRLLAYLSMERPGFESDRRRLMVEDLETGSVREIARDLDRSPDSIHWMPDSAAILFPAADRGRERVFRVDLSDGVARPVTGDGSYSDLRISPDGGSFVAVRQGHARPPEIVRFDLASGTHEPLDRLNDAILARLAMPEASSIWFEGARGDRVHAFVFKPAGLRRGRRVPAVFVIHGGPQGSFLEGFHWRWNLQLIASQGYVVVAIDFHGSIGYGQAFVDSVSRDWGGAPFEDIMKGVEYVVANVPEVDGGRLAAVGASYGGFMVNWILGRSDRFRCLVSHAGVSEMWSKYGSTDELWFPEWEFGGAPWENPEEYDRWSPLRAAGSFGTPTLVTHGANDFRVSSDQGVAIFTALQRRGVPSRLLLFPDEDHFIRKPKNALLFWQTIFDWFRTYLDPLRPAWTPPERREP